MLKKFYKMHGLGNDFAIFDGRSEQITFTSAEIAAMGDRHRGIGFDQMTIIDKAKSDDCAAFLRIYNSDGSEVGACGNVTRCVASLLLQETDAKEIYLQTKAAKLKAWASGDKITVDMGNVNLDWKDIPLSHEEKTDFINLEVGVLKNPVAVNVGNPHAVFFVEKADDIPLEEIGGKVEHHILFPERTNVEVAEVLSRSEIRMRVWERGVGITQACGTGACAVAVAGVRRGLTERQCKIILDGGDLYIEWRESDNHVLMTGAVALVYKGEIDI